MLSLDLKFAYIYFSLSLLMAFLIVATWAMRRIINKAFARSGHDFFLRATGHEPKCATCAFRWRCPYAGGDVCKFTKLPLIKL